MKELLKDFKTLVKSGLVYAILKKEYQLFKLIERNLPDHSVIRRDEAREYIEDYRTHGPVRNNQKKRLMREDFKPLILWNKQLTKRIKDEKEAYNEIELAKFQDRMSQD